MREGGRVGSGTGQKEKMGCNAVPKKVSAGSSGNSGAGIVLQSCSKSSLRGWAFKPLCWSLIKHSCPRKRAGFEQITLQPGQSLRRLTAEGSLLAALFGGCKFKSFLLEAESWRDQSHLIKLSLSSK